MKLIQLNIWQGRMLRQVLEFLQEEQPDFICMQEVYSSDIHTRTHNFLDSFERVQALFPEFHGYFSASYDLAVFDQKVRYGNGLLSRLPLEKTETLFTNGQYRSYQSAVEYQEDEITESRNLQRVVVRLDGGKTFCLLNHQGYWDINRMGTAVTVEILQKVAKILKASPQPLIFAGDLNIVAESPAMQPIHAFLRDLTQEYKLPTTLSELGKVHDVACDHICISDGIEVRSFGTSERLVSDHKALILEFDVA